MTGLDWAIISVYILAMIGLSIYLGRGQENQTDYYVGGRSLPWWAVGLSTMATQSSAISFISIPAFVALRQGGGLRILQYELAVPLAMLFVMLVLMPAFRRLNLISVYEYLEDRFGLASRTLLSGLFLLSRGISTGFGLYAIAIVLSVMLGLDPIPTVLLVGIATLIYDTIGGMKAVVYSDVVQMVILLAGIALTCYQALQLGGGWSTAWANLGPERQTALDYRHLGLGDGSEYNVWALVLGGVFLYASYYGCDQTQTQRLLAASSLSACRQSLLFNGFFRFPLVVLYTLMGITVGGALAHSPDFQARLAEPLSHGKLDYLIPVFIMHYVPAGARALILAAILAAAMSSLDSSLNSLSASTMRDFYERFLGREQSERAYLWWSRGTTVAWGILIAAVACLLTRTEGLRTVVESINQVGSLFYGPILAAFVMGVALPQVNQAAMLSGTLAGVCANLSLWRFAPGVSWLWWNPAGCLVALAVAVLFGGLRARVTLDIDWDYERGWAPAYLALVGYFGLMLLTIWWVGVR